MHPLKVVVLLSLICTTECCNENMLNFIKDFLHFKQPPMKIIAFVCWEISFKIEMVKNLKNLQISFRNVNDLLLLPYEGNHYYFFVLDTNCNNFTSLLHNANNRFLRTPYRWLVIGDQTNIPKYLNILLDSQFYIAEEKTRHCIIKSLYKRTKYDSNFIQNDVGEWNNKFLYFNELSWAKNRSNLNGLVMNSSLVTDKHATDNKRISSRIWSNRDAHVETELKVQFRKWNNALIAINAIGNTSVATTWGDYNETTGLFSGMIGDLQSGQADIGGSIAFILWNRIGIVDYISPGYTSSTCFVYRAPALSLVSNVFILPFAYSVWAASCALIFIICISIYIIIKWEYRDEEFLRSLEPKPSVLLPYFSDVSVLTFGGLCQQGTEAEPRSASGRIAMLISFIALMFLYTAYSANVVAMLQSTSETVNSIEAFLNSKIELGVENTTYMPTYFRNITEPIRKAIYEKKIAPQGKYKYVMDAEAGIKKVRDEFFAFHTEPSTAYTIIQRTFQENEKCSLRELNVWTISQPYLSIARNSSYRELIKIGFRKVEESGVQDREFKILYLKKPVCQGAGSTFTSVGLTECYYAFYIFGIGCVICLVLLGIELIIFKKREKISQIVKGVLNYTRNWNKIIRN